MQDLSPYLFIHIGLIIRLLRHAAGFALSSVVSETERLEENLGNANFNVSSEGLFKLKGFIEELNKDPNPKRAITANEVSRLGELMNIIEQMVFAEAQTKKIYILTETRFNLDNLVNKPWKMFAKENFFRLPSLASFDISEGFKCIVFSRATAAAFHLLRATEGTLRAYYLQLVKRNRVKSLNWGSMTQDLSVRKAKDQNLITRLDFIRSTYRNPTSHPDARYDIEQAQDLVGLCIDAINAMAASLPEAVLFPEAT